MATMLRASDVNHHRHQSVEIRTRSIRLSRFYAIDILGDVNGLLDIHVFRDFASRNCKPVRIKINADFTKTTERNANFYLQNFPYCLNNIDMRQK